MSGGPAPRRLHDVPRAEREHCLERLQAALAEEPAVVFAYAFGSFIEDRPFEDIDVAVFVEPSPHVQRDLLAFQLDLAARLEHASGFPVDLVLLNEAPLGLRAASLAGRLLYSRDEACRAAFVERTGLQRMDTAWLRRESLRDLLGLGGSDADRGAS